MYVPKIQPSRLSVYPYNCESHTDPINNGGHYFLDPQTVYSISFWLSTMTADNQFALYNKL